MNKSKPALVMICLLFLFAVTAAGCAQTGSDTMSGNSMETQMDTMDNDSMDKNMGMEEEKMDGNMEETMQNEIK